MTETGFFSIAGLAGAVLILYHLNEWREARKRRRKSARVQQVLRCEYEQNGRSK